MASSVTDVLTAPPAPSLITDYWLLITTAPTSPNAVVALLLATLGLLPAPTAGIHHETALPLTLTRWSWSLTSAEITGLPRALAIVRIAAPIPPCHATVKKYAL